MKGLALLLPSLALLSPLCLSFASHPTMAKADEENRVYIESESELNEGYGYSAYVKLDATEELNALALDVHFDAEAISVNSVYNLYSSSVYDSKIHDDYISFTYIFDSFEVGNNQDLFYFNFNVNSPVTGGSYYFDIVITEAYGPSLNDVVVSASRKNFSILEAKNKQSAWAYPNMEQISASYGEEFSFTYSLASIEPSAGEFILRYDDELFGFVSLTKGNFFDGSLFDYNADTKGEIYISFANPAQATYTTLFTITFSPLTNIDTGSVISLDSPRLYDQEMNLMNFTSDSLTVNLAYNSSFDAHPKMSSSLTLDEVNKQIEIEIHLEEDSHLGAGDFVLEFDKDLVSYKSYEKHFSPTFFTVNDKPATLAQGQVKFSILSLSDITEATNVISFLFGYEDARLVREATFVLSGSGLTDSLTSPIELDISGGEIEIPATDFILKWAKEYLYMDDPSFSGEGSGRCQSEGLYALAKDALLDLDNEDILAFQNNSGGKYTDALARYLAWASANHDDTPFAPNAISGAGQLSLVCEDNILLWPIIIASVAIASTAILVLVKRRKTN